MQGDGITEFILDIEHGQFDHDAGAKWAELLDELKRVARQKRADANGSLTIKLAAKVGPEGNAQIVAQISKSSPKVPGMPVARWIGKGGTLMTSPENQTELPYAKKRNPMEDGAS
jgi:hypothetical protein